MSTASYSSVTTASWFTEAAANDITIIAAPGQYSKIAIIWVHCLAHSSGGRFRMHWGDLANDLVIVDTLVTSGAPFGPFELPSALCPTQNTPLKISLASTMFAGCVGYKLL